MPLRTVLLDKALPFNADQWQRLMQAIAPDQTTIVDRDDAGQLAEALETAEIAILAGDLDERVLRGPYLGWIHCDHAGLTRSARPEIFERGLAVTGSAGRSGPALAEHAMMFALMLCSGYQQFYEAQKRHEWRHVPEMANLRALSGRTLAIVGMGHTGPELALRAKAFGMRVLGYRRRDETPPPGVDAMFSVDRGDRLTDMLEQADVVALVINLSDATRHLIDAGALAHMKPGAVLINMSRGGVVDHDALVAALRSGHLGGAGLDVTDPEPLPADHPLWDIPNVLITPHFTAALPDRSERSLTMILDNLRCYRTGAPMTNLLSPEDVWTGQAT